MYGFFFLSTLVVVYSFECCHWSTAASYLRSYNHASKYDIKGGYAGRIEITVQIVGVSVFTYMLAQTVKKKQQHTHGTLLHYFHENCTSVLEVLIGEI